MKPAPPTLRQNADHTPALAAPDIADLVRAKLLADLGEVQVDRVAGRRIYRPRAELLAEAVTGETFALVMDWVSSSRRGSVHTKRAYVDDIRGWGAFCAELGLGRFAVGLLTTGQVRIWRLAEEARLGPGGRPIGKRTIRRRLSALSSLHRYAAGKDPSVGPSPVTEDDIPVIPRGHSSSSTPVLELRHVQALAVHAQDERERLVVLLLYILAGRIGEVCDANVGVVRRDVRGRLVVDLTRKEDKKRLLVIPDPAAELLLAHTLGREEDEPLLLDADGRRLDRHDAKRMLARIGRHAGVLPGRAVTPHVLRASRITHMLDAGVPLEEVQAYADHNDPATTIGYRDRRNAAERNARLARTGGRLFAGLPPAGEALPVPDGA